MTRTLFTDRRTFLRAGSASLLLPAFSSMGLPALARSGGAEATPPKRLCFVFFGMGVSLPPEDHAAHKDWHWFPHELGPDYKFTKSIEPLAPYREKISVLGGLSHPRTRTMYSHSTGAYFLSGADPEAPAGNSISADQVYANHIGSETRYPFITLSTEGGVGDFREPHTLSYSGTGQPIPSIGGPRALYEELFRVQTASREAIERRYGRDRSILDALAPDLKRLNAALPSEDRDRLGQYANAVRSLEERIARSQAWLDVPKPAMPEDRFDLDVDPIQDGPTQYIDAMYQLIHSAFVTDSTRIASYAIVDESPGALACRFPQAIGLPHHHSMSHDFNSEGGYERWGRYDQYLAERFASFLKMMDETDDPFAEGSLLDNTIILYGSGTSTEHNPRNFPLILAGGQNFGLKHGHHHRFEESVPMSNLLLTLLQQLDTPIDRFSDSTGTISEILA